ncbi:aldo/keto reductase [Mangrovicoccus algicola]|uniref:Aldo/keto reductase n=1 Tax=Mangrovicoccus algicola TaxID=2771008 RepID=A0A8J6YWP3_9RHOB|nr:aldo/keto reductase [Mangrovicoccus algicola]MBE3638992.1 aldo/keto reductase [Mangrovicoccus algicola]
MKKIPLGQTGLLVTELCLGTMTWGSQNTEAEGHAQIDMAADRGINFMDTAEMYPVAPVLEETVGDTEEIIGNWFARTGRRDDWVLATKIGGQGGKARGGAPISGPEIRKAVEASLRRLKTDVIDIYQLHWPNRGSYAFRQNWRYDPSAQNRNETVAHMQDVLAELDRLIREGKLRHVGLSNESAWGMATWTRLADEAGLPRMATIQNEYSLLYREFDTDAAEASINEQIPLLAYSPLATGLLTGKYRDGAIPEGSRATRNPDLGGRLTPRALEAEAAYAEIARRHGLDPVHMALAFCLSRPFMGAAIIGATSLPQLEQCLAADGVTLSDDCLADIAAVHKAHPQPY